MEEEIEFSDLSCTPPESADAAKKVTLNLLSEKSRRKYEKQYDLFIAWCNLKKGIKQKNRKLLQKKKAPEEIFLMKKVVLIMEVFGACRRDELVKMTIKDIEDKDSLLIVQVSVTKTRKSRAFTVTNSRNESVDLLSIFRRYVALRPLDQDTPCRLFLRYSNGKCFKQVVGKVPREIVQYLNLPEYKLYTAHSLRRISLLVNGGGDIVQLKRDGGWKSSSTAEEYIEESISNKIETAQKIMSEGESSHHVVHSLTASEHSISNSSRLSSSGIIIKIVKTVFLIIITVRSVSPVGAVNSTKIMEAFLMAHKFTIVGLCEAWLSYGEADYVQIGDFCTKSLFSRQSSNYGGSLIMTTDGFNCSASTNVEQLSIDRHCELSGIYILTI
ncbi:hypothetical protein Zmor_015128 [Zophobas morio]|uniref:Tyr recombinase domain-containing protein n=1 Tax=Zophobas morio TaxID=2755281 RepID=A0AA38IDM4_9CUCU|nr:hypothetical protein Zmor_015128 [Zophobas morio]